MNTPVHARIEMILKHFNLNQKQLAKQAGLPENTLSNAKKGKNIPNIEFFNAIYKALPNINPHWLYMGNGQMISENSNGVSMVDDQETLKKMDSMMREIDYLREQIRDKEEIINLLKTNRVI